MATTSQLSILPSQNTAPVFKYDCLYTHDLVQKKKRWRDGILAYHTFNKRVMVYDLTSNFIGDTHWREAEPVQVGDDLRLDRGVLVTIGEAKGQKDQDISEIFVRKNAATREPKLPPKKVVLARSVDRKPPALADVLKASRNRLGGAPLAHARSSMSIGSSPYDIGSERPSKRQKLADDGPPRRVLVEKPTVNRLPAIAPKDRNHQEPKSFKKTRNAPIEGENDFRYRPATLNRNTTCNPQQLKRARDDEPIEDIVLVGKRKRTERPDVSKTMGAKTTLTAPRKRPSKSDAQKTRDPKDVVKVSPREPFMPILSDPDQPKQKLMSSKTRRKKLIFQSLSPAETEQASSRTLRRKNSLSGPLRNDQARARRCPSPIAVNKSREVIIISSPEKKWTDSEISDDEKRRPSKHPRKSLVKDLVRGNETSIQNSVKRSDHTSVQKAVSGESLIGNNEDVPDEKPTHEANDFYGLTAEENLLAALVEHPIKMHDGDRHPQDMELASKVLNSVDIRSMIHSVHNHDTQSTTKETTRLTEVLGEGKTVPQAPTKSFSPEPSVPLPPRETSNTMSHEIPSDTATTSVTATTLPASAINLVADETSLPISANVYDQGVTPNPILQPEAVAQANDIPSVPSLELPIPKQRALRSIAPMPALLRAPNQIPGPITHQKPLPQFRPPQQTSVPVGAAGVTTRNRRSPLQKSLSTIANGRATLTAGDGIASLTRAGSDGGLQMTRVAQKEYDEAGPWSREAFDLFGWTPDMPKGRILGPVAGRGCACRATAAAAVMGGS